MIEQNMVELGVGGGLAYLLIKLVLDFLSEWRRSRSDCVQQDQWNKFLLKFEDHHTEDKQLLRVIESLESAINRQSAIFERLLRIRD